MPIVVHGDPFSVSTRLVTITLEYLGVKYTLRLVDVTKGDHLSTAYSKVRCIFYIEDFRDNPIEYFQILES